jgi:S1-C subfamily serine protease
MHGLRLIKSLLFRLCPMIAVGLSAVCLDATAQQPLQMPSSELSTPGTVQKSPLPAPVVGSTALTGLRRAEALTTRFEDSVPRTRGAQDISLFRDDAPSVVLILTKNALGSGSLLQDNVVLTNFHVIDHKREVTVVFKPADPSGKPAQDEVVEGEVIKVDVQRDLALVRPRSLPNRTVRPLQISSSDLEVGADVAAIGHPEGQRWTFTKGIVSQIRPDYQWSAGPGDSHRATVIQTQTPINPGNSGGPLLSFDGKSGGVNSFRATGSEGLNFAVAAKDIDFFLANQANGLEALICNDPKIIFEGRNKDETASIRRVSLQCDSATDIIFVAPDKKSEPYYALVDSKRRGKTEGIVFDRQRSGSKWDTSIWDPQGDDTFPLKGIHPDGKLMPSSFVQRCGNRKPLKDLKCG